MSTNLDSAKKSQTNAPLLTLIFLLCALSVHPAMAQGETSVVAWQGEDGGIFASHFNGPLLFDEGGYSDGALNVNLPMPDDEAVSGATAPSPLYSQNLDRLLIARAIPDYQSWTTSVYVVSAGYQSALPNAEPRQVATVEGILNEPVELIPDDDLMHVVWFDDWRLAGVSSENGEDWSDIEEFDEGLYYELISQNNQRYELSWEEVQEFNARWATIGRIFAVPAPVPSPWIIKTHDSGNPPSQVFNFVIACDGFTFSEQAKFVQAAKLLTANLVSRAPYYYNQNLFNVYAVSSVSKDSGFDSSQTVDDHDTPFGAYRIAGTTMLATTGNAVKHAAKLITGNALANHVYGYIMFNPAAGDDVAILPWDDIGVPISYEDVTTLAAVHELMHTSRFGLGDHERRTSGPLADNKSADPNISESHAWQHWFTGGIAGSRLIEVSSQYRYGLLEWVASGHSYWDYYLSHAAYTQQPGSRYNVSALDLFNVNLWESELSDVPDLNAQPLFTALRACAMNSLLHHAQVFCPTCSESILRTLHGYAGSGFNARLFQLATGAYLELQLTNSNVCGNGSQTAISVYGTIQINGMTIPISSVSTYPSQDGATVYNIARIDLSPWLVAGVSNRLTIKKPNTGTTRIWLPGLQIVNGAGARHPVSPVGRGLISSLASKHPSQCDFEYWDLAYGTLVLDFMAN